MRSVIGNKLASWYYLTKQNNVLGFLNELAKQNTLQTCRSFNEIGKKSALVYYFKKFVWIENFPQ